MNSSLEIHGKHLYGIADAQILRNRMVLCLLLLDAGETFFLLGHFIANFGAFLFHLAHRSGTLSIFVEVADRLVREVFCFF